MSNHTYDAEAVKKIPVREYLESQNIAVRGNRCAATWRGGDNLSVSIDADKNCWYDHKENEGGSVIDLAMKIEGLSVHDAINALGQRFGIAPDADGVTRRRMPKPPAPPNWVKVSQAVKNSEDENASTEALSAVEVKQYFKVLDELGDASPTDADALNAAVDRVIAKYKASAKDTPATPPAAGTAIAANASVPFANFIETESDAKGRTKLFPRKIDELTADLWTRFGNYPRVLGSSLFAYESDAKQIQSLPDKNQLFAWIQGRAVVNWKSGAVDGFVNKDELFARLIQTARTYNGVSAAPHYPCREDVFYTHDALPPAEPDAATFWSFVDFFNPADDANRTILAAFIIAPMFYDGVNDRPMLLVDTDDAQGSGKTSVVKMIATLYDEEPIAIDLAAIRNDPNALKKRVLSSEGRKKRIVLFDNLDKTLKSAALADIITSRSISGMAPYGRSEETRPNDLTFFGTVNGASVDTDMATRCYTLRIKAVANPDPSWANAVTQFVKANRLQIFADILALMDGAKERRRIRSRFGRFDAKVLSAVCGSDDEFDAADTAISSESERANEDAENATEFVNLLEQNLAAIHDYDAKEPVVIPNTAIDRMLAAYTGKGLKYWSARKVKMLVKSGFLSTFSKDFRALPERDGFPRSAAFFIFAEDGERFGKVRFQYVDYERNPASGMESLRVKFRSEVTSPMR